MGGLLLKFKQLICWHAYKPEETRGFYGEPKKGATCIKCEKVNQ